MMSVFEKIQLTMHKTAPDIKIDGCIKNMDKVALYDYF